MTIVNAPRRSADQARPAQGDPLRERLPQARPILLETLGRAAATEPDPDGVVCACIRSLVGLAYRTPGFDVQVRAGEDLAVRLHRAPDGLRVQLIDGPDGAGRPDDTGPDHDDGPDGSDRLPEDTGRRAVQLTSPAELDADLALLLGSR